MFRSEAHVNHRMLYFLSNSSSHFHFKIISVHYLNNKCDFSIGETNSYVCLFTVFPHIFPDTYNTFHEIWWRHQMETFSALLAIWRGIHRSPVNSPHKGQWRGALMFSLICVWIIVWVNNREAGDLRRYRAHYDVIVMNTHRILCDIYGYTIKSYIEPSVIALYYYFTILNDWQWSNPYGYGWNHITITIIKH